ncbi:MAG: hypothetical protein LBQ24_06385 [Candidatus Peribacteria bacterium]|jgi:hypothetical protein|nr:hypothetical protein [Candidatus Peribacteria bacterium]
MLSKFAVFSQTESICKKSRGKKSLFLSISSIDLTIHSHFETLFVISSKIFS